MVAFSLFATAARTISRSLFIFGRAWASASPLLRTPPLCRIEDLVLHTKERPQHLPPRRSCTTSRGQSCWSADSSKLQARRVEHTMTHMTRTRLNVQLSTKCSTDARPKRITLASSKLFLIQLRCPGWIPAEARSCEIRGRSCLSVGSQLVSGIPLRIHLLSQQSSRAYDPTSGADSSNFQLFCFTTRRTTSCSRLTHFARSKLESTNPLNTTCATRSYEEVWGAYLKQGRTLSCSCKDLPKNFDMGSNNRKTTNSGVEGAPTVYIQRDRGIVGGPSTSCDKKTCTTLRSALKLGTTVHCTSPVCSSARHMSLRSAFKLPAAWN